MKKVKQKIYRKYQDFYSAKDLQDPDTIPALNLTIADFNAQGYIENPRAPCVATIIDPDYIKDARTQKLTKKFRMKTDILQLREITRKKFMIYATQEMHLEKKREAEFQERIFKRIETFNRFAAAALKKMEMQSFHELRVEQEKLKKLKEINLDDELNAVVAEHQSILVEDYFDEIVIEDIKDSSSADRTKLLKLPEIMELEITDKTSGMVERIKEYMDKIVAPYLEQRHHLNAEIWLKGYEHTRNKISNYNRRYTNLAILDHVMSIVYEKFKKTYSRITIKPVYLRDPEFMRARVNALKESAHKIINELAMKYKQDKIYMALNAYVPVILESLEPKPKKPGMGNGKTKPKLKKSSKTNKVEPQQCVPLEKDGDNNLLVKVEKIQVLVMELLNKFDALPPNVVKKSEKIVRRRIHLEHEMSRRALTKQNRMHNWREHMKRHELQRAKDY